MPGASPLPGLTGEGVVGVEEVNLLAAVPVDVTGGHADGVALPVPQRVVRGAALVLRHVHQPAPRLVVLEHQVRAVVPVGASRRWVPRGRGREESPCPVPVSPGTAHSPRWAGQGAAWFVVAEGPRLPSAPRCGSACPQGGLSLGPLQHISGIPCLPSRMGHRSLPAAFGRAGQAARRANPLGTLRPAGSPLLPPCTPVNKLHNGHCCLQNHRWLPAVACAPPGSPSCPGLVLPWADTPSPCRDEPPSQGQQAPEPTQQLMAMWLSCASEGQPGSHSPVWAHG